MQSMSAILEEQKSETSQSSLVPRRAIGKSLRRKEDFRFLTGKGKFVDDIKIPGTLYGAVLRSTYGHARITRLNVSNVAMTPSVKLLLTSGDIPRKFAFLPVLEFQDGSMLQRPVLASNEVSYVGEPIAYVVAESRQSAEDALEQISVEYDPLPVVSDPLDAIVEGSPLAHSTLKHN